MASKARTVAVNEEVQRNLDLAVISDKVDKLARDSESSHQARDARVDQLQGSMDELKKMFKEYISGKQVETGEGSNSAARQEEREEEVRMRMKERQQVNLGDFQDETKRGRDYRQGDNQFQNQRMNLPRFDFPIFTGEHPIEWIEEAEFYFDTYQTADAYKSRMASMNFSGDAREWYRSYKISNPHPPWPILKEEVMEFFTKTAVKPFDEFKRVYQKGSVDDYIKEFQRAQSRLICQTRVDNDEFFLGYFISGLRDEIRNTIALFNPVTIKDAFKIARQIEVSLETNTRKTYSNSNRPQIGYDTGDNREQSKNWGDTTSFIAKNHMKPQGTLSIEERRIKGLCFKCNEKFFPGHKCNRQAIHLLTDQGGYKQLELDYAEGYGEEEASLAVCDLSNSSTNGARIAGSINLMPITALIDSGSTHSFLNPKIAHRLKLHVTPSNPLRVMTAGNEELCTKLMCENQKFELQKQELEANFRLLEVRGYDMILGLDWLAEVSPVHIDLRKGILDLKHNGNPVQLKVGQKVAEVKVCEQVPEVSTKKSDPNKLIVRLFHLDGGEWWPVEEEWSSCLGFNPFPGETDGFNEPRDVQVWRDYRRYKLEGELSLKGEGL